MEVIKYLSENGNTFENESECNLADELYNLKGKVRNIKQEIKALESTCTHSSKTKVGTSTQSTRTIQNSWGEDCGEVYETQPYKCNVCGKGLYLNITDGSWNVW